MSEFSLMKEREVPELVLWEKYLVYATVFGISEKVLKQLKVVYPQLSDEQYMANGYTYLYLINSRSFRTSFISTLNTSVGTSYTSLTNYSSGAGSGGGFSSGGGFGGGGGRNGWQIKNADKSLHFFILNVGASFVGMPVRHDTTVPFFSFFFFQR